MTGSDEQQSAVHDSADPIPGGPLAGDFVAGDFVAVDDGETQSVTAEAGEGEIIGMLRSTHRDRFDISVRAATDCVVVIADADTSGEIASRNAELAAALNRVASIRRRRMERVLDRPPPAQLEGTQDGPA